MRQIIHFIQAQFAWPHTSLHADTDVAAPIDGDQNRFSTQQVQENRINMMNLIKELHFWFEWATVSPAAQAEIKPFCRFFFPSEQDEILQHTPSVEWANGAASNNLGIEATANSAAMTKLVANGFRTNLDYRGSAIDDAFADEQENEGRPGLGFSLDAWGAAIVRQHTKRKFVCDTYNL
jgi:hypothetical protein